jgi:hypothetical protein
MVHPPRLVQARYLRIYLTEDNAVGGPPDIAVKFGLFGCYVTSDAPSGTVQITYNIIYL